ncbi:hypothetical protein V6N12_042103 [Hibiscus sabdariffa]|uniref:Uncharacterized protein n=1 Tax=Hibiscus sabdariffa TaxID=183260 RepID=A0ABR2EE81_9ROSI
MDVWNNVEMAYAKYLEVSEGSERGLSNSVTVKPEWSLHESDMVKTNCDADFDLLSEKVAVVVVGRD